MPCQEKFGLCKIRGRRGRQGCTPKPGQGVRAPYPPNIFGEWLELDSAGAYDPTPHSETKNPVNRFRPARDFSAPDNPSLRSFCSRHGQIVRGCEYLAGSCKTDRLTASRTAT